MNIFYPFKNSSGKKNFPSFFKLFVTLLLCLAGVSVAQAVDWKLKGSFDNWTDHSFTKWSDNEELYYVDIDFSSEETHQFIIYEDNNYWTTNNQSISYYCNKISLEKKTEGSQLSDISFQHKVGKYRIWLNASTMQLSVSGIIVNIIEQTKVTGVEADIITIKASYTLIENNGQTVNYRQIVYYLNGIPQYLTVPDDNVSGNTFWYTVEVSHASTITSLYARVTDTGADDCNRSVLTPYNPTPTTPTDLNLYVRGKSYNDWGYPGEEFKGITEDGIIYTWNWTESPKEMSGPFKIAYCNIDNPNNWNNDLNFGLENVATLTFGADGTWSGKLIATSTGDMTINPAKNVSKITFNYNTKELRIETETSSSCQALKDGFTISGRFNAGKESPWEGSPVDTNTSGSNSDNLGVFADDYRTITLTANSVAADSYVWSCTGYSIDGESKSLPTESKSLPTIEWGASGTTTTATLSLPGTYTFVCKATCNGVEATSDSLTITAPAPEIGFDGPIIDGDWVGHDKAYSNGYMTRTEGTLKWTKTFNCHEGAATVNDKYQFVVIQRYKNGCTAKSDNKEELSSEYEGWAGYEECGSEGSKFDNKINYSEISFKDGSVRFANVEENNYNFLPSDFPSTGAELTLTVTMTGYDSYEVVLSEYKNIFATATTDPDDVLWGTVSMTAPDGITVIENGSNVADYVGQQITVTADPVKGYRVKKWVINEEVYVTNDTEMTPTVGEGGLTVIVYFEPNCRDILAYDVAGGGTICGSGTGHAEVKVYTYNGINYQLYCDDNFVEGSTVCGNGNQISWQVKTAGEYTVKAYDPSSVACESTLVSMSGSVSVAVIDHPTIIADPDRTLTVLQTRKYTSDVPVKWEIIPPSGDGVGAYCTEDGYLLVSESDKELKVKFTCVGMTRVKATMLPVDVNGSCTTTIEHNSDSGVPEVCADDAPNLLD